MKTISLLAFLFLSVSASIAQTHYVPNQVYTFTSVSTTNPTVLNELRIIFDFNGHATITRTATTASKKDKAKSWILAPSTERYFAEAEEDEGEGTVLSIAGNLENYWIIDFDNYQKQKIDKKDININCNNSVGKGTCNEVWTFNKATSTVSVVCSAEGHSSKCARPLLTLDKNKTTNSSVLILKATSVTLN